MIDEGYTKFDCQWTHSPSLEGDVVEEIIKWRRPLFDAGLVGHYADIGIGFGNISVRSKSPVRFIITGTQTGHLAELSGAHLAEVTGYDIPGNSLICRGPVRASSESLTHAAIYELDAELNAVAHVHSDALWQALRDTVPTTNAAVPYGTPEMAEEFRRLYRDTDFASTGLAVMAGHEGGLISTGRDLAQAAGRLLDPGYSTSSMATGVSRNR